MFNTDNHWVKKILSDNQSTHLSAIKHTNLGSDQTVFLQLCIFKGNRASSIDWEEIPTQ